MHQGGLRGLADMDADAFSSIAKLDDITNAGGGEQRSSDAEKKRKDEKEKEGLASRHALEENIRGNRINATRVDGIETVTGKMIAGVS